jgi:hypothetical protein
VETPLQGKPPGSFTPYRLVCSRAIGDGEVPTSGYHHGMTEWRESIREQIAQLER